MAAPYTNQLINRVRQDIAYSQARNARVAALGRTLQSMPMPSNSSLPAGMSRTALGPTFKGQGGNMLTTIKTPWGSSVTVDAAHAGTFAKLGI